MPGGSEGSVCATAASTNVVAATMSVPQEKSTEISTEPRLVVERTLSTPSTWRTARSRGTVTSSSVWSAGRVPALTITRTRGNCTTGNSPFGSCTAENAPASANASMTARMERVCRATHPRR